MQFKAAVVAWLALFVVGCLGTPSAQASAASSTPWVTAYYPVWNQQAGGPLLPDKIDYSAITHLVHFAIVPRADGAIEQAQHGTLQAITPAQSADVVSRAHAAHVKALICLGGANSGPSISPVLTEPLRSAFVRNLIAFAAERGYDGIDVDMEPILPSDEANFVAFVKELRAAMKATHPRWLLTIPASGEPGDQPRLCAELQDDFDQINIQTYDLSGPWEGWKTWYNGSLYGGGQIMLTATRPLPSVDEKVKLYLAAGVPARKLGVGIAFYGYAWSGASGPAQSIAGVTATTLSYSDIMDQYFQTSRYHWDPVAHAPYLSVPGASPSASKFISYDDPRLAREKVLYARTHGLGGVIIWQIGGGYRASQPPGHRNGLLAAVKSAANSSLPAGAKSARR